MPLPELDPFAGVQARATGATVEVSLAVVGEQSEQPPPACCLGPAVGRLCSLYWRQEGEVLFISSTWACVQTVFAVTAEPEI